MHHRLLLLTITVLCSYLPAQSRVPAINERVFYQSLQAGVTVVDARGTALFRTGAIPGSLDIGGKNFSARLPANRAERIVLVCGGDGAGCQMWRQGAQTLRDLGYSNLVHWGGGVHQWQKRNPLSKWALPEPAGLRFRDGLAYLIQVPELSEGQRPGLLVWCHPGDGTPKPEFKWWQGFSLFDGKKDRVILLAPQARNRGWSPDADGPRLAALIDEVIATHDVDPAAVVLGGHSSGGFFTLDWGLGQQETFQALVPAAAFATRPLPRPHRQSAPSIHIYHSTNDGVIPYAKMEKTKAGLEEKDYTVDLVSDNQRHNIGPKLAERMERLFQRLLPAP
jgi:predicted esterase/rhodanese-related sulfurtransferase